MNNLAIVGRIGKVGELKYTQSGKAVVNFSVAVDNGKDSDGEKRQPTWFEVALWEKQAEGLAEYLKVGDRIGVIGQIRLQVDEGKDGTKYPKLMMDFPRVELLGDSNKQQATTSNKSSNKPAARPAQRQAAQEVDDQDIPF